MKKSFVILLMLSCLTIPILPQEELSNTSQEELSDFDKFLEELFGKPPKPTKEEEEKEPEATAPSAEPTPTPPEEKIPAAEKAKIEQKGIHQLNEISKLLGNLIPVAENDIFSPKARDKMRKEIYKKVTEVQTKPTGIIEEKLLEDKPLEQVIHKKISYQKQGVYGLEALIKEIIGEDIYTGALVQKTDLQKTITSFTKKLSALNKTTDTFFKDITQIKPTEEEQLTQLRLPLKQRKEPMSLLRIEKKKVFNKELKRQFKQQKRIQDTLKNLYAEKNNLQKNLQDLFVKEIPDFTKQLESLINDPTVKQQIEKAIKTAEELAREAEREAKSRYSSSYRGDYEDYDRPSRWGRDWEPPYYRKDKDEFERDRAEDRRYGETREEEKEKPEEAKAEEKAKPEEKAKKPREKKEKDKEKLKTNLISLMSKATTLIKEICSTIKATTTIIDEILGTALETNHYKIQELNDIVTQIEKNKNTAQAKEDKKQIEWKSTERAYHQAFENHLKPLVLLAKYGSVAIIEKPDGRYTISLQTETQNTLRNIYRLLKSIASKKIIDQEKAIAQEITDFIKGTLTANLDSLELFNSNLHLLSLGIDNTIEPIRKNLFSILQMIITAKNPPLPISIAITNPQLDRIKQIETLALEKFSSLLQKNIFEVQKHKASTEKHFKQLTQKIDAIIKSQKIPGTSSQEILKTFAYRGTMPTRGQKELTELMDDTNVSIAGKPYTYRQVAQYHFSAAALNELDQCIQLIDQIRKQTNWNLKQPAPPAIHILDALWGTTNFVLTPENEIKTIQNAQACNSYTTAIQNYVTRNLATVAGAQTNLEKAKQLFTQYYNTLLQRYNTAERTYPLFIHCKIKTNGATEAKAFIYNPTRSPQDRLHEVKAP